MSAAGTTYETLLVELDRGAALVTLNRTEQLNAPPRPTVARDLPWCTSP